MYCGKCVSGVLDETSNVLNQHCQFASIIIAVFNLRTKQSIIFFILNSFVPLCVKLKDNVLKCVFVGV